MRPAADPGEVGHVADHLDQTKFQILSTEGTPASAFAGAARRRGRARLAMAGNTKSTKAVEVIKPPITTVASGRCTSAPVPVGTAIGMKPTAGNDRLAVLRPSWAREFLPAGR